MWLDRCGDWGMWGPHQACQLVLEDQSHGQLSGEGPVAPAGALVHLAPVVRVRVPMIS
jgi:hypothetical protein